MKKTLTLAPGAVIEPVGDDVMVMVMVPGNTDILRISGPAAKERTPWRYPKQGSNTFHGETITPKK